MNLSSSQYFASKFHTFISIEIVINARDKQVFGIIIRMYFGDHNPPHFHAIYQDETAEYDINTLAVIRGNIPVRAHALVLEWASLHRAELLEDWKLASEMKEINKIAPLK